MSGRTSKTEISSAAAIGSVDILLVKRFTNQIWTPLTLSAWKSASAVGSAAPEAAKYRNAAAVRTSK